MYPLDPVDAVARRNADDLFQCLRDGWVPPVVRGKSGPQDDHTVWTQTILSDWLGGLKVLDAFLPGLTRKPGYLRLAIQNTALDCLIYLWEHMDLPDDLRGISEKDSPAETGSSNTRASHDDEPPRGGGLSHERTNKTPDRPATAGWTPSNKEYQNWCTDLMCAMGDLWTKPYETKNPEPLLRFFLERGLDLSSFVFAGEMNGPFQRSGHSFFTRAVGLRQWSIADLMWPHRPDNIQIDSNDENPPGPWRAWPRTQEVLIHLLNVVVGDYRPLRTDGNETTTKTPAEENPHERQILVRWLKEWPEWVSVPEVRRALSVPCKNAISAWFRLPCAGLDSDERAVVWHSWEISMAKDPQRSWLCDIAMNPDDSDVHALLEQARKDQARVFPLFWHQPIVDQNEKSQSQAPSPHDFWIDMGGEPERVAWMADNIKPKDGASD